MIAQKYDFGEIEFLILSKSVNRFHLNLMIYSYPVFVVTINLFTLIKIEMIRLTICSNGIQFIIIQVDDNSINLHSASK